MRYSNFKQYSLGTIPIGIGFGVISLIACWMGFTLFLSLEFFLKYGISALLGYMLTPIIAMTSFGLVGNRLRKKCPDGYTLGDYLRSRLRSAGYRIMLALLFGACIMGLFMQGHIAANLLMVLFDKSQYPFALFLFFAFCFFSAGIGGADFIRILSILQVLFVYPTVILLPIYFFFAVGVRSVYDGIHLYHPYLLVTNYHQGLIFLIAASIIGISQMLYSPVLWQRVYMLENKKISPTFFLAGIISATFPLAFSILFMIGLSGGGFDNSSTLWLSLLHKIDSPVFTLLFISSTFLAISTTYITGLHSLTCLFVRTAHKFFSPNSDDKQQLYAACLLSFTICLISLGLSFLPRPPLLITFVSCGVILTISALAFTMIATTKNNASSAVPICAILGIIVGYISRSFANDLTALLISVLSFSLAFLIGKYLMPRQQNDL